MDIFGINLLNFRTQVVNKKCWNSFVSEMDSEMVKDIIYMEIKKKDIIKKKS